MANASARYSLRKPGDLFLALRYPACGNTWRTIRQKASTGASKRMSKLTASRCSLHVRARMIPCWNRPGCLCTGRRTQSERPVAWKIPRHPRPTRVLSPSPGHETRIPASMPIGDVTEYAKLTSPVATGEACAGTPTVTSLNNTSRWITANIPTAVFCIPILALWVLTEEQARGEGYTAEAFEAAPPYAQIRCQGRGEEQPDENDRRQDTDRSAACAR